MAKINDLKAKAMYLDNKLSDSKIAKHFKVDRTTIVHARNRLKVNKRESTGDLVLKLAEDKLTSLGFKVTNMKTNDKTFEYDLLINDKIKLEVMGSKMTKEKNFKFALTISQSKNLIESNKRIRLSSGRTKKLYRKTCDFIIAIGIDHMTKFWVIPADTIPDNLSTLALTPNYEKSKYFIYQEAWHLLNEALKKDPYH